MQLLARLIEPRKTIPIEQQTFRNRDLYRLVMPIIVEQLLTQLVGICDTLMVSYAGETAVSGVSLVNQINNIFIFIFGAIASGGAVIASQYVGRKDPEKGNLAAGQLLMITVMIATFSMLLSIGLRREFLGLLFGAVEPAVMQAALLYLVLSALSFPFLAVYNSSAALFRSMGMTKQVMQISIVMNIINVGGNAIGIFVLHAGVAGVAVASLLSRAVAAIVMLIWLLNRSNTLFIEWKNVFCWNGPMIGRILHIAVPNGVENGLFQAARVAVTSIVSLFGTTQIAANGVAQSFWAVGALFPIAIGYAFVTVIGQCMGAGQKEAADYYNKKLLRITYIGGIVWNSVFIILTPALLSLYSLSAETRQLTFWLVLVHGIFNMMFSPVAFPLASGMRAAGDVRYTMFASIFATVGCRVFFSIALGIWLNMGVMGITLAMCLDWFIKAVLIAIRYRSRKWMTFQLI